MTPYEWCIKAQGIVNGYLQGWTVIPESKRGFYGRCIHTSNVIVLSTHYLSHAPDAEIENTILHEIAHALVWERFKITGHNDWFYAVCREIGAKPQRLSDYHAPKKWRVHCNGCGKNLESRNRKMDLGNRYCGYCKSKDLEWWPS